MTRHDGALPVPSVRCFQVDCAVGDWSGWFECDADTGRMERTRPIIMWPSSDGNVCPALDDATGCLGELLLDAAKDGDLAAVEARRPASTACGSCSLFALSRPSAAEAADSRSVVRPAVGQRDGLEWVRCCALLPIGALQQQ